MSLVHLQFLNISSYKDDVSRTKMNYYEKAARKGIKLSEEQEIIFCEVMSFMLNRFSTKSLLVRQEGLGVINNNAISTWTRSFAKEGEQQLTK